MNTRNFIVAYTESTVYIAEDFRSGVYFLENKCEIADYLKFAPTPKLDLTRAAALDSETARFVKALEEFGVQIIWEKASYAYHCYNMYLK